MTVPVITFQSTFQEYFCAGQIFTNHILLAMASVLWFLSSPPELQIHTHVLDSFILCGFTSSKVSLRPAEESFLLQRDPPALWELLNTQNKISHFFIKLSWAFSGIKTSRLGNVPYLASLNSTSGNLLEQKDGRGGGNIIFCLIGFD